MAEYIEREKALKAIESAFAWGGSINAAYEAIEEIPAADVQEVRHGKWIIHTKHFTPYQQCSFCGLEIPIIATENKLDICLYRYCPNCNSRMDLEETK